MTILILTDVDDLHALHMADHLAQRGERVGFLDSRTFPSQMSICYLPLKESGHFRLIDGSVVDFADIESVYWRSYSGVVGPSLPDEQQSYIAENDARSLFESLLIRLPVRWVNGWVAFQSHQTKPAQLAAVGELGVRIPATLLTNEAEAVCEFCDRFDAVIFKPVQGGAHTRRLTSEQLTDDRLTRLRLSPITLQEEVPGTNIRVFVAGPAVLALEVGTDNIDFRDDQSPRIEPHRLPPSMQTQCQRIAEKLHLVWTGIDFRLTPDGDYVVLEANPSPMFLGFEQASGLPLTERLGDLLTGDI